MKVSFHPYLLTISFLVSEECYHSTNIKVIENNLLILQEKVQVSEDNVSLSCGITCRVLDVVQCSVVAVLLCTFC